MQQKTVDLMAIARGDQPAECVLKNGFVVNVYSGEIVKQDVALEGEKIIAVGQYSGVTEIDCTGKYICPGLIDSHLHLESTMVHPSQLVEQASLTGTTTFIVDPHEAANVAGKAGINFIIDATKDVSGNVYVMVPSCVPASPYDDNGATLLAADLAEYLSHSRVLGLGELMSSDEIVAGDAVMHDKIELFRHTVLDGHAGSYDDKKLNAYRFSGVETDHECITYEAALRELRCGMYVHIREGSATKNLDAIVTGIVANDLPTNRFTFCTDDKHISEIIERGHISYNVRRSVELGMNPIKAIQMATINAATCYGLKHLGAISPGCQADIIILNDLEKFSIEKVYFKGKEIVAQGSLQIAPIDAPLLNSVHLAAYDKSNLQLAIDGQFPVINVINGQILTTKSVESVPQKDGDFVADAVYNKVAVFERHKATGKVGVGVLKNYGIKNGAIASTVSHDSHNLIVVGDNDDDIMACVARIEAMSGGYCLASGGQILAEVPLEIMGLMSRQDYRIVEKNVSKLITLARELGVNPKIDPLITLSFLSLTVIPEIRIIPRGVFEVR